VADDGFSAAVMRRVARRTWQRRLVLAAAGAAGVAVANQPIWNLSLALSRELGHFAGRWPEIGWVLQNPLALAAGVLVVVAPAALHWLEE
jgi:hypothetical protein